MPTCVVLNQWAKVMPYPQPKQLECRIVITFRRDGKVAVAMCDPKNARVEPLGVHGPDVKAVDKVIGDLKASIERAGHLLTICERSE